MIAPTQIRKPENWQDFEKLCKKLWGEIWSCSDTIKRNGRSGQNQCGIDIYGIPKGDTQYSGIQCKGKDDYTKSQLTKAEIDEEIVKAFNFKPSLKRMIFTTTANKDVNIEEYIRIKNTEHLSQNLFEVDLYSWEDIVDLLEERQETYNWYINHYQYKDAPNIEVYIDWGNEYIIRPQYIRTTKVYHKKIEITNPFLELNKSLGTFRIPTLDFSVHDHIMGKQKRKIDYRWCKIPINIRNSGTSVIEDYKLQLLFEPNTIEAVDDRFRYYNPPPILYNHNIVLQENTKREQRREVFESSDYKNVIEFKPKNPILVQKEDKVFQISVKPKDNITSIKVYWSVLARNYSKEGELFLKVEPLFEDIKEYISVETDSEEDIIKKEIIIEPKIIEE